MGGLFPYSSETRPTHHRVKNGQLIIRGTTHRTNTNKTYYILKSQPTTFDHINIKYIWGPHVNNTGTQR